MDQKLLYGIQQIGIGATDVEAAAQWYAHHLDATIQIFDDCTPATHMAPYMGGSPQAKRAMLLLHPNGGGGFEIWQYTKRKPQADSELVMPGDIGINYFSIRVTNLQSSYERLLAFAVSEYDDLGFYIRDPFGNLIELLPGQRPGGVCGCTIGVSSLATALPFYHALGFDEKLATHERHHPVGKKPCKQVVLKNSKQSGGRFGGFFGPSEITLIQLLEGDPRKPYENRFWGDPGYMHLCFDVYNLPRWVDEQQQAGFPFSILSNPDFRMGDAGGHWGYMEDPDGTLIEMVETHHLPIIKKIGWKLNLSRRSPVRPVAPWILWALRFKKLNLQPKP
ncbi:VOC family protein [Marinoscillum furvescens]|uniref:Catechol 2,3-dioxygenase-like lactoylglutathione lyase family enzyme n=1 Tax=Marinoscillum furvescens DSM 4134 TaxID=1122208 RepID=A0A3D9LHB5_MARFU|nr:VOC family protein [Marinoscillum furvescens]REE05801.1 catechol 2,3-dioxygenase-like lactoylglutathione lyase family enzyme [Marinoscillum furvescens DSM 4134]